MSFVFFISYSKDFTDFIWVGRIEEDSLSGVFGKRLGVMRWGGVFRY